MGLRISTNMGAMVATRSVSQAIIDQTHSLERLGSGQRIVRSSDDPAGLSISEGLRAQIRSLNQASRNANDSISLIQVAEGGLSEIGNILIRLRELGIQASSDTVGDRERGIIHAEAQDLIQEIDRIASVSTFNDIAILNGQGSKERLEFQIGTESKESSRLEFDVSRLDVRSAVLGVDSINYESIDSSRESLERVDDAMSKVFLNRSSLGSTQERLESAIRNIATMRDNLTDARSKIVDVDMATETTELTRTTILQSVGVSMLAQANSKPNQALKLI